MRSSRAADRLELVVSELAHGGDGVAITLHDGDRRAVFVPGALPEERIAADVNFATRPARAKLVEILSPSASRVVPPCAHATRCGGCNWMHITRISQPNFHEKIVRSHLPASWSETPIVSHAAAEGLRTRARLHVRSHRGKIAVGFYESRTHEPVVVDTCIALHPALDRARAELAHLFEKSKGEGEAEIALGELSDADSERRVVLDLKWKSDLPPTFFARMEQAVDQGHWQGACVRVEDARTPAIIGDPTPWIRAGDGRPLRLAPGGFAQASESGNVLLAQRVAELAASAVEGSDATTVLELFSGAGNFTVLLARLDAKVTAVESNAASCDAAQRNLRDRALTAKVVTADADAYKILGRATLVVLDPPRSGARNTCEKIVAAKARHVVYVSCDPATLGRDLTILERGGYSPRSIETFEMFPDTSHVETVVSLSYVRPGR